MKQFLKQFWQELLVTKVSEKVAFILTLASYVPLVMGASDIVLLSLIYWIVLAIAVSRIMKFHGLPYMLMIAYILGDTIVCIVGLVQGGKISLFESNEQLVLLSIGFGSFLSSWYYMEVTGKTGILPHIANSVALQISYVPLLVGFYGSNASILGAVGLAIADVAMIIQLIWVADFWENFKKDWRKTFFNNLIWLVGIINSTTVVVLMID